MRMDRLVEKLSCHFRLEPRVGGRVESDAGRTWYDHMRTDFTDDITSPLTDTVDAPRYNDEEMT